MFFNRGSAKPQGSASGCQPFGRNRPKLPFLPIWFITERIVSLHRVPLTTQIYVEGSTAAKRLINTDIHDDIVKIICNALWECDCYHDKQLAVINAMEIKQVSASDIMFVCFGRSIYYKDIMLLNNFVLSMVIQDVFKIETTVMSAGTKNNKFL